MSYMEIVWRKEKKYFFISQVQNRFLTSYFWTWDLRCNNDYGDNIALMFLGKYGEKMNHQILWFNHDTRTDFSNIKKFYNVQFPKPRKPSICHFGTLYPTGWPCEQYFFNDVTNLTTPGGFFLSFSIGWSYPKNNKKLFFGKTVLVDNLILTSQHFRG